MKDLNKQELVMIHGGAAALKAAGVAISVVTGYLVGSNVLDQHLSSVPHADQGKLGLPFLGALAGTALWTSGCRSLNTIVIGSLVNFSVAAIAYIGGKSPEIGEL
ncbi:MAG: hypothetical protein U1E78_06300 [Gammaproteobacteria bacterium]